MASRNTSEQSIRFCIVTLLAAGLFTGGGCQQHARHHDPSAVPGPEVTTTFTPTTQPSAAVDPTAPDSPVTITEPGATRAEALAHRVQNYAQSVAAVADKRRPTTEPSAVEWIKPDGAAATPATQPSAPAPRPEPHTVPVVRPVMDNTPSTPNQVAYIPSDGSANPTAPMRITPQDLARPAAAIRGPTAADALQQRLAQHVKDYPRDLWAHLDYQLLQFIQEQQVPALEPMAGLPIEDRELLSTVLDGLSNLRNALRSDNNMLLSRKVRPVIEMADRLRAQADLTIPTLSLCTRVDGFGVYEPIDPARFPAGKRNMAIIYCEVDNFSSQTNDKHFWETKLSQETVLYTEGGLPVWQDRAKTIIDHSRNRRHDFFIVKMVELPPSLTIGRYLLKVTVQDLQANRVSEATVPVEIVAQ